MIRYKFIHELPHRYVFYGRMSSDSQNPLSPDQQFDSVGRTIVRNRFEHWIHVKTYRDDAVTGRKISKRPGFMKMLTEIRAGVVKVDLILVDTIARFGRVEEAETIQRELWMKYGVLVLTANTEFADPTSEVGSAVTWSSRLGRTRLQRATTRQTCPRIRI